jgi:hypothetical protein
MPFCHNPRSFILKAVSTRRNTTTGEEEVSGATVGRQEKKGYFDGEVYKKQKTFEPYIYFS